MPIGALRGMNRRLAVTDVFRDLLERPYKQFSNGHIPQKVELQQNNSKCFFQSALQLLFFFLLGGKKKKKHQLPSSPQPKTGLLWPETIEYCQPSLRRCQHLRRFGDLPNQAWMVEGLVDSQVTAACNQISLTLFPNPPRHTVKLLRQVTHQHEAPTEKFTCQDRTSKYMYIYKYIERFVYYLVAHCS